MLLLEHMAMKQISQLMGTFHEAYFISMKQISQLMDTFH